MIAPFSPHHEVALLRKDYRSIAKLHLEFSRNKNRHCGTGLFCHPGWMLLAGSVSAPLNLDIVGMPEAEAFIQAATNKPALLGVKLSISGLNERIFCHTYSIP